jgi:two-component sensor histidine kinase
MEDIPLSFEHTVPFGLLLNELICNALKHAFPQGRKGTITIALHRSGTNVCFTLQDDGLGLPAGFNASSGPSMGLKVVTSLAHQLGGELIFSSDNGCHIKATFRAL